MVYWKIYDCFAFLQGLIDYQTLTKTESCVKYYGFSLVGGQAVCKEGYASAEGYLAHLENIKGPWQTVQAAAEIVRIDVHGPVIEIDRLRGPLASFPTTFWSYLDGAFFVPAKYVEPSSVAADRTLSVMVYWKLRKPDAFMAGVAKFQARTKQETEIKYYGFARNNDEAVCKEGYDTGEGFLAHMKNVEGPWQAAIAAADVARVEVHGPSAEVDKLRAPLKDFPVTYWGCADGAFFAPSRYVPSLTSIASPLNCTRRCFIKDTLLKTLNNQLVPAQQLQLYAQVCSSEGQALRVRGIEVHLPEEREIVELRAGEASLTVTGSHRVMVQHNGEVKTSFAEMLQEGDEVVCMGGAHRLDVVRKYTRCVEVVEIVFDPDDPVEAFLLPPTSILTKGQTRSEYSVSHSLSDQFTTAESGSCHNDVLNVGKKKCRRGGMARRGKKAKEDSSAALVVAAEEDDGVSYHTYDPYA
jgi:hypothetical protein